MQCLFVFYLLKKDTERWNAIPKEKKKKQFFGDIIFECYINKKRKTKTHSTHTHTRPDYDIKLVLKVN